jgi:hypothetical protein
MAVTECTASQVCSPLALEWRGLSLHCLPSEALRYRDSCPVPLRTLTLLLRGISRHLSSMVVRTIEQTRLDVLVWRLC